MAAKKRKPTRRDLLIILGRCQHLFGQLGSAFSDRKPNRAADVQRIEKTGLHLCIEALEQDDPITKPSGPWAENG